MLNKHLWIKPGACLPARIGSFLTPKAQRRLRPFLPPMLSKGWGAAPIRFVQASATSLVPSDHAMSSSDCRRPPFKSGEPTFWKVILPEFHGSLENSLGSLVRYTAVGMH